MKLPDELEAMILEFRDGLLGGRSSDRMCFAVCAPLHGYLSFCGHSTELVEGSVGDTNHYWLRLPDGTIIDPTADQFSTNERPMPGVYIGPLPEAYVVS